MNKNILVLAASAIMADLTVSYAYCTSIEEKTIELARFLQEEGVDLDYILVLAGGNPNNLRELTNLAYEEFKRTALTMQPIGEAYNGNDNNNGNHNGKNA